MNLVASTEDREFQAQVKDFISDHLTDDIRRAGRLATSVFADPELTMAWQRILHAKGWAAPHWPVEYGGTGWTLSQRAIFAEALINADAPPLIPMGLMMCGPCLIGYGTDTQKNELLPRILSGEDFWCQGYSEPDAGSDLVSLRTSAIRDGDDYIINGSKIWTTYAHHANKMFCLVRTCKESKPQSGISFLLLDMNLPGISVRPIIGLDEAPEQCEVFFENVRVPASQLVGQENQGWTVAKYLLVFERGGLEYAPVLSVQLAKIRQMAQRQNTADRKTLWQQESFQLNFARCQRDIQALEFTEKRIKSALSSGGNPGALSSMTKVIGTELQQKLTELALSCLGAQALIWQPDALVPSQPAQPLGPEYAVTAVPHYLNTRATSIYGGSNEVQRNIIAKMVLGL
ncbi:MAG: acyl-CoA dehydrogenase family protein [Moraxellaceae bacterium]|nr:acyl-CoA dehydrogenase family protein [Moraxellaceae bacterium]MDZ4386565.1 acyl-CoA dehydrogenase family protein [Moraxellaceae bacterium]